MSPKYNHFSLTRGQSSCKCHQDPSITVQLHTSGYTDGDTDENIPPGAEVISRPTTIREPLWLSGYSIGLRIRRPGFDPGADNWSLWCVHGQDTSSQANPFDGDSKRRSSVSVLSTGHVKELGGFLRKKELSDICPVSLYPQVSTLLETA